METIIKSMKKITLIGHYGVGYDCYDGQTVKTKTITKELGKRFGSEQIRKVDTHGSFTSLLKAPFIVLHALKNSKNIVMLPARNGVKVYAPLLHWLNYKDRTKLHYVVIGGWLPELLEKKPSLISHLCSFSGVYVETRLMKTRLNKLGLQNVFVMPNSKELTILRKENLELKEYEPFKACTFSRVMKEKGIEDAINAVIAVNNHFDREVVSLDIFGQVDPNQKSWFEELSSSFPPFIKYAGVVPFEKSVETLKNYFVLLFPTFYEGEGFAGTLIDAMSAGVPVIASDWKFNSEIVIEGKTGYLFKTHSIDELKRILIMAANNPEEFNRLKWNCIEHAVNYRPEAAVKVLIAEMA